MARPLARTCVRCGKPKGCFSFVLSTGPGTAKRDYYHPDCFRAAKEEALANG